MYHIFLQPVAVAFYRDFITVKQMQIIELNFFQFIITQKHNFSSVGSLAFCSK
jgi:hypothetical protein